MGSEVSEVSKKLSTLPKYINKTIQYVKSSDTILCKWKLIKLGIISFHDLQDLKLIQDYQNQNWSLGF